MIMLGKTTEPGVDLNVGDVITLGNYKYIVCNASQGLYLGGVSISNKHMFEELGYFEPKEWLIQHNIFLTRYSGTFPYMNRDELNRTVKALMKAFNGKGKKASIENKQTFKKDTLQPTF